MTVTVIATVIAKVSNKTNLMPRVSRSRKSVLKRHQPPHIDPLQYTSNGWRIVPKPNESISTKQKHAIAVQNAMWPHGLEGNNFDSEDGMRTTSWGPLAWMLLSLIARNFPTRPTDEHRKAYHNFLISLCDVLPCGACRTNLKQNLAVAGYDPSVHLQDRQSFSRFINHLHNTINIMLDKPTPFHTYDEHRALFEQFRAKCVKRTVKREAGCHGKNKSSIDPSTCVVVVVPETVAKSIRSQHGGHSMVIDDRCVVGENRKK